MQGVRSIAPGLFDGMIEAIDAVHRDLLAAPGGDPELQRVPMLGRLERAVGPPRQGRP